MNAAGLKIPWVEDNPDIINEEYLKNGQEQAAVAFPGWETEAQLVDVLARIFAGAPPTNSPAPYTMILKKDNFEDPTKYPIIYKNYLEQYTTLWGK